MHSQLLLFKQLSQICFFTKKTAFLPNGAHRVGKIGLIGENKPIAFLFNAAAICKGPVLAATKTSAEFIKAINCCKLNKPAIEVTLGCCTSSGINKASSFVPLINILNLLVGKLLINFK